MGGKRVLTISTKSASDASWRGDVKLPSGRYRFEGRARTKDMQPTKDDKGEGAGLRISNFSQTKGSQISGDADWTSLTYEFDVPATESTITLVCELRARRGQAWFDLDSLQVMRLTR